MATTQSLIGLLGATLLLARVGFAIGRGRRGVVFALTAAALSFVPFGGIPVAGYVRGFIGDLSMTTLVLLGTGFVGAIQLRERRVISVLALAGAVLLYPMALGLGTFDPYRLGFAPQGLLVGLLFIALAAWWRRLNVLLVCVLAAVAAHALGLLDSTNLWDYILDPWVAVASIYDLRSLRRNS